MHVRKEQSCLLILLYKIIKMKKIKYITNIYFLSQNMYKNIYLYITTYI